MSVFDKVKEIIAQELNVDAETIALESNLKDDLGADSIDAVQIIMELEDAFGISIEPDNAEEISTVKNIVDYIEKLL